MDKLNMHTPSLADENFAALAKLFPNAVTETIDENGAVVRAIDKDVLTQEISAHVVEGREERYQFTWPDKRKSVLLANAPIAAALRPCREESVDFDNTENLYIEGDNLDVLKLLRETYLNRVKMIYIDPPYNTGHDFVYEDDFAEDAGDFLRRDEQYDEQGNRLVPNIDSNGRFHTDWLNMIYPRLRVARDLLTEDGAIFISIDDNEVDNLRKLCDEVFGESNFIGLISWEKRYTRNNDAKMFSTVIDYVVIYRKSPALITLREPRTEKNNSSYGNPDNDPRGVWTSVSIVSQRTKEERPNLSYGIANPITGNTISHPSNAWKYSYEYYEKLRDDNRFYWGQNGENSYPRLKRFLSEVDNGIVPTNLWNYKETGTIDDGTKEVEQLIGRAVFTYPKPISLIKRLHNLISDKDSIVLDFFSGSATTAHAVMQLNAEDGGNRKFIMVQIPEECDEKSEAYKASYKNICEIGKERIRRAGRKIKEESPLTTGELDIGFRVLKLDSSNMKDVYYTPEEFLTMAEKQRDLFGFEDNIKPDRSEEDLLFQVMLDLGIPLSAKITQDGDVFYVNDNYLIACFEKVDTALITEIAQKKPYYAVFRDASFASDSAMVNFDQVFNTYSPGTIRKVL